MTEEHETQCVESIRRILGHYAWNGRTGVGSFLSLDFGDPEIHVANRIRVRGLEHLGLKHAKSRAVDLRGRSHLWIYMCVWTAAVQGAILESENASVSSLKALVSMLSGQKLLSAKLMKNGSSEFVFDLETVLRTRPSERLEDEQWLLYDWGADRVLSFLGSGKVMVSPIYGPPGTSWQIETELLLSELGGSIP